MGINLRIIVTRIKLINIYSKWILSLVSGDCNSFNYISEAVVMTSHINGSCR